MTSSFVFAEPTDSVCWPLSKAKSFRFIGAHADNDGREQLTFWLDEPLCDVTEAGNHKK